MDLKYQESTRLRPDGLRLLDAPYLHADIPDFIRQLKQEESWGRNDRNGISIFKSEGLTIVLTALRAQSVMKDNFSESLLTIHAIEGSIKVMADNETIEVKEKEIITVHSGICHSIEALTDAIILIHSYRTYE